MCELSYYHIAGEGCANRQLHSDDVRMQDLRLGHTEADWPENKMIMTEMKILLLSLIWHRRAKSLVTLVILSPPVILGLCNDIMDICSDCKGVQEFIMLGQRTFTNFEKQVYSDIEVSPSKK